MEEDREVDVAAVPGSSSAEPGKFGFNATQPIDLVAAASFDAGQPVDLEACLLGGQAHRWKRDGDWYSSVLWGNLIITRQHGTTVKLLSSHSDPAALIPKFRHYLRLDDDLPAIYADITRDSNVSAQVKRYPGLRVLRQEPWECLVAYICSANSNIETIHLNMERLSNEFGSPLKLAIPESMGGGASTIERNTFPTPADLAEAGEAELRRLKLGFRAPYVYKAAVAVLEGRLDLQHLTSAPYEETKSELMSLKGIGDKIADCIALMSLEKLEAFPIDVWVRRALADWYFPGQKTPTNRMLLPWAQEYFGRYAGYANQYLFHGRRLRDKKGGQAEED